VINGIDYFAVEALGNPVNFFSFEKKFFIKEIPDLFLLRFRLRQNIPFPLSIMKKAFYWPFLFWIDST